MYSYIHKMHVIWIILLFLNGYVKSDTSPCFDYVTVNDTLIDMYQNSLGKNSPCKPFPESFIPLWYRINGTLIGNVVALECPASTSCGGGINIWINDSLPTKNDGITTVSVCGRTATECCTLRNKIRVKNCISFYVFELRRPPNCDVRYCFKMTDKGLDTDLPRGETTSVTTVLTKSSSTFTYFQSNDYNSFSTKVQETSKSTNVFGALSSSTTPTAIFSSTTPLAKSSSTTPKAISSFTSSWTINKTTSTMSFKPSTKAVGHLVSTVKFSTLTSPLTVQNTQKMITVSEFIINTNTTDSESTETNISTLMIIVSVTSVTFVLFVITVVIVCLRRRQNIRKRLMKGACLHIQFHSTSREYTL